MLRGETTTRSILDPETLTPKLQAHGVARLRGETAVWVILDESDLRKPYASAMEALQQVKRLEGRGMVLAYDAVRLLVALGWVAVGFLFDLGVTLTRDEVRLLRRLGGGEDRPNRPPGKIALSRGLRRLVDYLALEAILRDEEHRPSGLPPRIATMLGRLPSC